jgi:hypothetical protein
MAVVIEEAEGMKLTRCVTDVIRYIDHLPFRVLPHAVEQFSPCLDALVPVVAGSDLGPFEPPVLALA